MNCESIPVSDIDNIVDVVPLNGSVMAKYIETVGSLHVIMNEFRHRHYINIRLLFKGHNGRIDFSSLILQSIKKSYCFLDTKLYRLHYVLRILGKSVLIGNRYFHLDYYDVIFHKGEYKYDYYDYTRVLFAYIDANDNSDIFCKEVITKEAKIILDALLPGLDCTIYKGNVLITRRNITNYLSVRNF